MINTSSVTFVPSMQSNAAISEVNIKPVDMTSDQLCAAIGQNDAPKQQIEAQKFAINQIVNGETVGDEILAALENCQPALNAVVQIELLADNPKKLLVTLLRNPDIASILTRFFIEPEAFTVAKSELKSQLTQAYKDFFASIESGDVGIVRALVERYDLNVNQKDMNGDNAGHIACRKGDKQMLRLLHEKQIDFNALNRENLSIGDVALNACRFDIVEQLDCEFKIALPLAFASRLRPI